jgi:hypothetical protein
MRIRRGECAPGLKRLGTPVLSRKNMYSTNNQKVHVSMQIFFNTGWFISHFTNIVPTTSMNDLFNHFNKINNKK